MGVEVIDLSLYTVLPGLMDTHTHVLLNGDITAEDYDVQLLKQSIPYRAILGARNARIALDYGFTTIRDVETEGAGYADVDVKKAINNGVIPGPRMQVATRALDVTGAYPLIGYAPDVRCRMACRWSTAPMKRAKRCASRLCTARTGSKFTAIAVTGCARMECSMTFRRSRWMN